MSLVATVADPLTEPVPDGWDAFVAQQRLPPMWYSSLIRPLDWCGQTASSVVVVRDSGGDAPMALFRIRHLGSGWRRRFVRPGRRAPLGALAECRLESTLSPGLVFSEGLDDRDRTQACRVFERALRRASGGGRWVIGYRNLRDQHLAVVPAAGRARLRSSPVMVLSNRWPDLASYLSSLPRKARSQLQKIHGNVGESGEVHVDLVPSIGPDEACWLAEVVRRRHSSLPAPRPPRPACYFQRFIGLAGSRFLTYRDHAGRLIAYAGFWDDGRDLTMIWWGSRGARDGRRDNLYFDQYLRMVELMVRTGRQQMVLGAGMGGIKARYGARPEQRWALVGPR